MRCCMRTHWKTRAIVKRLPPAAVPLLPLPMQPTIGRKVSHSPQSQRVSCLYHIVIGLTDYWPSHSNTHKPPDYWYYHCINLFYYVLFCQVYEMFWTYSKLQYVIIDRLRTFWIFNNFFSSNDIQSEIMCVYILWLGLYVDWYDILVCVCDCLSI